MVRAAVVWDIHYGFNRGNKKGAHAPRLTDRFVRVANENKADLAVDGGDRGIFNTPDTYREHLNALSEKFNRLSMPRRHLWGNHDAMLSIEETEQILGHTVRSNSTDLGGVHFIFWSPAYIIRHHEELVMHESDMTWLKNDLAKTNLPCVLFSHVPLDNDENDMAGPKKFIPSFYKSGPEIRALLEESGKVKMCMAGHRHRNRHREINNIHYITHQSLTQRNENTGHPRGAFSLIDIDPEKGEIKIKGYGVGQPNRTLHFNP